MNHLNIVVLKGRLSRPAEERVLPTDGTRLLGLDLTIKRADAERAESVPVVWHDAPAAASNLDTGDEVVVVGHVGRRFFRAGGSTQSRTEVVARVVVPSGSKKRVRAAVTEAIAELTEENA